MGSYFDLLSDHRNNDNDVTKEEQDMETIEEQVLEHCLDEKDYAMFCKLMVTNWRAYKNSDIFKQVEIPEDLCQQLVEELIRLPKKLWKDDGRKIARGGDGNKKDGDIAGSMKDTLINKGDGEKTEKSKRVPTAKCIHLGLLSSPVCAQMFLAKGTTQHELHEVRNLVLEILKASKPNN